MSITYSFHVATEQSVAQLRALLGVAESGALVDAYGPGRPAYVLIKRHSPDPIDDSLFASAYGFVPRVSVTVELAKSAPDEISREAPALAVMRTLMRRSEDDLYISYLGDYPVLVRRLGRVTVDSQWLQHRPWFPQEFGESYLAAELVDPYSEPA